MPDSWGDGSDPTISSPPTFNLPPLMDFDLPPSQGQEGAVLQPDFDQSPLVNDTFPNHLLQGQTANEAVLRLDAHLSEQSPVLTQGVVWRIFSTHIDLDDKLSLIDTKQGGYAEFRLPAGDYFIHVAFGLAQLSKKISLEEGRTYYENIELNAGGLMMDVMTQGGKVNKNRVRFSIYQQTNDMAGQILIAENVKVNATVRLQAGSYHIVSTYGDANAIASADIRVEAGKLTKAMIEHHAAQVTLKLVREIGGEALADTNWVIMNDSGDSVREIANAYVDIVLVEGDYIAYARNKDQSYSREFSVIPGEDIEVDLLMGRDNVGKNTN